MNAEASAASPAAPRLDASANTVFDADLDPEYPDVDGVHLSDETLSLADARSVTFLRSRLTSCRLDVGDAVVEAQDTSFTDLDLGGVRIEGLTRVTFERCRLTGTDFGDARLRDVTFDDCALDLASMRSATLERVAIAGGRLDELDLSGAQLTDVEIVGSRIADLLLAGTRMRRVDVTSADLSGVTDLSELRGAIVSATQAVALAPRLAAAAGLAIATPPVDD